MSYSLPVFGVILFSMFLTLLTFPHPAETAVTMPQGNISRASQAQWTNLFTLADALAPADRVAYWADLTAVGAVYAADPLGEGPGTTPDDGPLLDYARVDCVTYVEQVLALTLSSNTEEAMTTLQCLRYKDGVIDFRWRNHYFVSDWLPNNNPWLEDITGVVGGDACRTMTKTISRKRFFADKGLPQYADIHDEIMTTSYLPRERVADTLPALRQGDLVVFVISTPGIIAGHVGLLRAHPDGLALQHAGSKAGAVVTQPLLAYLKAAPTSFLGCKFARLRPLGPMPAGEIVPAE